MALMLSGNQILNMTQHEASQEQVDVGVVDPTGQLKEKVIDLITFDSLPTKGEILTRAGYAAQLARGTGCNAAMIGGAPYFQEPLSEALRKEGITPVFSFTRRESEDRPQPDGSVRKVGVFRHMGFVEAVSFSDTPDGWEKAG